MKTKNLLIGLSFVAQLFLYTPNSNAQFVNLLNFNVTNGQNPFGSLILSGNKLFGMTYLGGANGDGVVFTIDTNGTGYKDLLDFNITNGRNPYGSLTLSGNKLFGMTYLGGANGDGVVFTIDTNGTGYKDLLDFNNTNGRNPFGSLTLSGNKLFGMTRLGGANNDGVVFTIDSNGTGYVNLMNFNGTNGQNPYLCSLRLSGNNLFGMTQFGGANGDGVVFTIDTNGTGYKDLLDFNNTNGRYPYGSLRLSGNNLFGMTSSGGTNGDGVVFKYGLLTVMASNTSVKCYGGSDGTASCTATGGTASYTYSWSPGGQTTASINGLSAGTYTITVTDATGYTDTATTVITQPTALTVSNITPSPDSVCNGNCASLSITITGGTPGYIYSWSNGQTASSVSVCPALTQTYSITVTDANGCTVSDSVKTVLLPLPSLTMNIADDSICSDLSADTLTATPTGGTFSGAGVTGSNFNPGVAGAGTHYIYYSYTNGSGCTNRDSLKAFVKVCTGVQNIDGQDGNISVYPNPFTQTLTIEVNSATTYYATMYNMIGQTMGNWEIKQGANTIGTATLPSGVYVLQMKDVQGNVVNKKVVKVE